MDDLPAGAGLAGAGALAGVELSAGERDWLAGLGAAGRVVLAGLLAGAYAAGRAAGAAGERARAAGLERLAYTDPLTGLPNRAGLAAAAGAVFAAAAAGGGRVGGLLADLDGFKPVNDRHGHGVGDRVLALAAARLRQAASAAGGTAARLGGDEFVVLLPGLPAAAAAAGARALRVAEAAAAALAGPYDVGGLVLAVPGSVGAATATAAGGLQALLAAADLAMYAAKRADGGARLAPDPTSTAVPAVPAVPGGAGGPAAAVAGLAAPRRPAARLRDHRPAPAATAGAA